ncbi:hypothetical protein V8C44DRAFT_317731 [Trichoderma aethiopicum]
MRPRASKNGVAFAVLFSLASDLSALCYLCNCASSMMTSLAKGHVSPRRPPLLGFQLRSTQMGALFPFCSLSPFTPCKKANQKNAEG